ncbi:MAG: MBL fold metallo-hydrolase [Gammaproteobacteria bacterium]
MSMRIPCAAALGVLLAGGAIAQQPDFDKDGAVLVDDQFAPLIPKIRAAITQLTDEPVRFVINTHWHPDHTGGNEAFGQSGSVIVAHDNTLKRLATKQIVDLFNMEIPPAPKDALPIVTFGESVSLLQGPFYPFIDTGTGGSLDGVIKALGEVLARTDANTKLIAGHAPVMNRAGLEAFRDMLVTVRKRVADAIARGKTQEEVLASQPTKEFDERYAKGFLKPDVFVQRVYVDLRRLYPSPAPGTLSPPGRG